MAGYRDLEGHRMLVRLPRRFKALLGLALLLAVSLLLWPRGSYDRTFPGNRPLDGVDETLDVVFDRGDVLRANPGLELADDGQVTWRLKGARYVVDENGDHFYPGVHRPVAPLDSNAVVAPADVFGDIDTATHLVPPPTTSAFPPALEGNISLAVDEDAAERVVPDITIPPDAFSATWQAPDLWEKAGEGPQRVQWVGFDGAHESEAEKAVREARRDAVRRGFVHSWQAYKDHAWGHDEVRPVSRAPSDPFNQWGATIIDTLDTLLLMGLEGEYDLCRAHVNKLNFHWLQGQDWSAAYRTAANVSVPRAFVQVPTFETNIRYLGGLISAYDLTGDELMLERALDLATILARSFDTASGLPASRIDPGHKSSYWAGSVSLAEAGSMSLEFSRLSLITKDQKWFDLTHRATEFIKQGPAVQSNHPPLVTGNFSPDTKGGLYGVYSFGGLADSYYEYLIKMGQLLSGRAVASLYTDLYAASIDAARKTLFGDVAVPGLDAQLLLIGKRAWRQPLEYNLEHLTCFAGGMLGLGARLLGRTQDMEDGERLTSTCFWVSQATGTGVQPEAVTFYTPADTSREKLMTTGGERYDAVRQQANMDSASAGDSATAQHEPIKYYRHLQGQPPGVKSSSSRYIGRPETIESVFYMYRLTGDKKWQERGWRMFTSWAAAARAPGGMASVQDAVRAPARPDDNMESFVLAETFKYHFLLQSAPDVLSLDEFVFNTEAHPFIVDGREPGSSGLWAGRGGAELGRRGEGTDAQKWSRLKNLERFRTGNEGTDTQ
ncbi:hypothetical protein Q8F55_000157 [Vanrija albida]|uniref:alpha-1,2-Mannosidase n=1 Tax=Vanrija albida TaxID=181172 RepID=A0ABR3QD22_9TREE